MAYPNSDLNEVNKLMDAKANCSVKNYILLI